MNIQLYNKDGSLSSIYDIPDSILDAARVVELWMKQNDCKELAGLKLRSDLSEVERMRAAAKEYRLRVGGSRLKPIVEESVRKYGVAEDDDSVPRFTVKTGIATAATNIVE